MKTIKITFKNAYDDACIRIFNYLQDTDISTSTLRTDVESSDDLITMTLDIDEKEFEYIKTDLEDIFQRYELTVK